MGMAWTTRVLRRLSRPAPAAAAGLVTPSCDALIRGIVCFFGRRGRLLINEGGPVSSAGAVPCRRASQVSSAQAENPIKSIAPGPFNNDFVCAMAYKE